MLNFKNLIKASLLKNKTLYILMYKLRHHFYLIRIKKRVVLLGDYEITGIYKNEENSSFFGYYNLTPWNKKGDLIFHETKAKTTSDYLKYPVDIIFFSKKNNKYTKIGESSSYNFQQGCMLQWYGDSDDMLIYNDFDKKHEYYISKVINTEGKKIRKFNLPIYSISKNLTYALSLNFDRLRRFRPDYGYFNQKKELPSDDKDGIWFINIVEDSYSLLLSLEDLKCYEPKYTMKLANHKVNHIEINPFDQSKFVFFHRWLYNNKKQTRLFLYDIDEGNLQLLSESNMISHFTWIDEVKLLVYMYDISVGNSYYIINSQDGNITPLSFEHQFNDGHPCFLKSSKNQFVSDTYPDSKYRYSKLFKFDLKQDSKQVYGSFYQPLKFHFQNRCDLHPKTGPGNKISIDSGHTGIRKMYIIESKS